MLAAPKLVRAHWEQVEKCSGIWPHIRLLKTGTTASHGG